MEDNVADDAHTDKRPRLGTEDEESNAERVTIAVEVEVEVEGEEGEEVVPLLEAPTAEEVLRFEGFEDKSDENKGKLIKKVGVKSEFWKHFLVWSNKPWIGACIKC